MAITVERLKQTFSEGGAQEIIPLTAQIPWIACLTPVMLLRETGR